MENPTQEVFLASFKELLTDQQARKLLTRLDRISFKVAPINTATSQIYVMLKNPFFYGEYQYPKRTGTWYKGNHEPLITKDIFDKVQKQLYVPRKSKWGAKYFTFKGLVRCKDCGAQLVGDEKFKATKAGGRNRHVYYHCSRQVEYYCTQPYIREAALIEQIIEIIRGLNYAELEVGSKIRYRLNEYDLMTKEHVKRPRTEEEIFYAYTNYLLRIGDNKEKASFLKSLGLPLLLDNRKVIMANPLPVSS